MEYLLKGQQDQCLVIIKSGVIEQRDQPVRHPAASIVDGRIMGILRRNGKLDGCTRATQNNIRSPC